MRVNRSVWALLLAMALVLSACGGGDDGETGGSATDEADEAAAPADDDAEETDAPAEDEEEAATEEDTGDATEDEGDEAAVGDAEPMVIEAVLPLSGALAAIGEAMSHGMNAAVEVVNANGGVLGNPVTVNITDNAGTTDQTAAVIQDILSRGTPHAVIPGGAGETPAGIAITDAAGIFTAHHITDSTFADPEAYPFSFGSAHSTNSYVASLVTEIAANEEVETLAVVALDDPGGEGFLASLRPAVEEQGWNLAEVQVLPDAIDATPQLQQVLDQDPDVLVLAGFAPAAGAMAQARQTLGVDIPTYAAQTFTATNLQDLAPESAYEGISFQNLEYAVAGTELTEGEAFQTFYEALLEQTGGEVPFPINAYVVAYNDVILATSAASLAGSYDAEAMAAAVEAATDEDMPLYLSPVGFGDNHFADFGPDDFVFVPYGPIEGGLMVPQG